MCEDVRIDEFTNKEFFFTQDPDQLPLEFYRSDFQGSIIFHYFCKERAMKLFYVILGATPEGRNIEQHDVFLEFQRRWMTLFRI